MGVLGYAVISLDSAYPELNMRDHFNERGQEFLDATAQECTVETFAKHGFNRT